MYDGIEPFKNYKTHADRTVPHTNIKSFFPKSAGAVLKGKAHTTVETQCSRASFRASVVLCR